MVFRSFEASSPKKDEKPKKRTLSFEGQKEKIEKGKQKIDQMKFLEKIDKIADLNARLDEMKRNILKRMKVKGGTFEIMSPESNIFEVMETIDVHTIMEFSVGEYLARGIITENEVIEYGMIQEEITEMAKVFNDQLKLGIDFKSAIYIGLETQGGGAVSMRVTSINSEKGEFDVDVDIKDDGTYTKRESR